MATFTIPDGIYAKLMEAATKAPGFQESGMTAEAFTDGWIGRVTGRMININENSKVDEWASSQVESIPEVKKIRDGVHGGELSDVRLASAKVNQLPAVQAINREAESKKKQNRIDADNIASLVVREK